MYKLQEIQFRLDNGTSVEVHLISHGSAFNVDIIFPPVKPAISRTISELPLATTAPKAFEKAATDAIGYATAQGAKVVEVDNPCNTEFLPAADELAVLQQLGCNAPVKVNGV